MLGKNNSTLIDETLATFTYTQNKTFDCSARKLQHQKIVGKYSLERLFLHNFIIAITSR